MEKNQVVVFIQDFIKKCLEKEEKPLFVLLGPTASGKTVLSLEIAKQFNGEIISADSRQVYRGMDIGTDKISDKKREGIPHYLIDVVDPEKRFTVADFKKLAEKHIENILRSGKLPMLVGGTGLYINAVTSNFAIPPENPAIRRQLMEELEKNGKEVLYKKLQALDSANASRIHPNNIPYILRALEILLATGKPKNDQKDPSRYACLKIGLSWPREILYERINARVDEQIKLGLVDEVKGLFRMGHTKDLQSMRSLGYREIIKYLEGELDLPGALELLKKNTRNFARRQITWFKRDKEIKWIKI